MIVTTPAIVFSSIKYGEADLIVTAYTLQDGIKTYILKRILKAKKAKLKASYFLPLTQLELVANHRNKGTMEYISEAKVPTPYKTLQTDIIKSSVALFLAEILKSSIQEEEANEPLYYYIASSLHWLDTHQAIANFHILFLLKLTEFLGFYPDTSEAHLLYFNQAEGCFEPDDASFYSVSGRVVANFKLFCGIEFDEVASIKMTKNERMDVLHLILDYYQLHLQTYKKPKSLDVLNQLFN